MRDQTQSDAVLVDVITNLLGVFILVTMISLLVTQAARITPVPDEPHEAAPFEERPQKMFPSFSLYIWVGADGIVTLPLAAIAQALLDAPDTLKGEIGGVHYELDDTQRLERLGLTAQADRLRVDWSAYRLTLTVDPARVAAGTGADPGRVPADASPDAVVEAVLRDLPADTALTVFVDPAGFERFGPLHAALSDRRVCFRWRVFSMTEGVTLSRAARNFIRDTARRC